MRHSRAGRHGSLARRGWYIENALLEAAVVTPATWRPGGGGAGDATRVLGDPGALCCVTLPHNLGGIDAYRAEALCRAQMGR